MTSNDLISKCAEKLDYKDLNECSDKISVKESTDLEFDETKSVRS